VYPTAASNTSSYRFWDINGAPFNKSIFAPYVLNITSGSKLNFFYDYPNECFQNSMNFLTKIYYVYWNGSCSNPQYSILNMTYNSSQAIGIEMANMIYYCYQFYYSVDFTTRKRLSLFSDQYDFWSSFLFNLMSRSVSIKNIGLRIYNLSTNMTIMGRGPLMAGEWSKIIRLILDFQSQNKASIKEKAGLEQGQKPKYLV